MGVKEIKIAFEVLRKDEIKLSKLGCESLHVLRCLTSAINLAELSLSTAAISKEMSLNVIINTK